MPSLSRFLTFGAAALALLLVPGPAVLYIVARSVSQGRLAGIVSALGTTTGALVHVLAAALGLSAIVLASAAWFGAIKFLGAAYLVMLGVRALRTRVAVGHETADARTLRRLFNDGIVVSVLNPKTALFFLAFLPQFIEPGRGPVGIQAAALGLTFVGLALCTDSMYALAAGGARQWFEARRVSPAWTRYVSGIIYIGLGVGAALAGQRSVP